MDKFRVASLASVMLLCPACHWLAQDAAAEQNQDYNWSRDSDPPKQTGPGSASRVLWVGGHRGVHQWRGMGEQGARDRHALDLQRAIRDMPGRDRRILERDIDHSRRAAASQARLERDRITRQEGLERLWRTRQDRERRDAEARDRLERERLAREKAREDREHRAREDRARLERQRANRVWPGR